LKAYISSNPVNWGGTPNSTTPMSILSWVDQE